MAETQVPSLADLEKLTGSLYTREYVAIKNSKFPSTTDRLKAYEYAKEAQDKARELLDMEKNSSPFQTPEQEKTAAEVWKYIRASLWSATNGIRNMKLRAEYVGKILSNSKEYLNKLSSGVSAIGELESITLEAIEARNVAMEAARAKLGKTSLYFSEMLKKGGLTYDQLVEKYSRRRYSRSFSGLEEEAKLIVLGDIVEASGRSNSLVNAISKIQGAIAIATAIILVGTIVWDVVTSNTPLLTAAKDTWVALGTLGVGFAADALASSAISSGLVAAGATQTVAAGVAFIGGIAASFILAALAAPLLGSLFDLMVNAFSLHIPPQLMTSVVTAMKVPFDSDLFKELTTPLCL